MKLYGATGGCSQASHIALNASGLPFTFVSVGRDKRTDDGRDFNTINAKGYTPALELEDGTLLTESLVILAYIAERSGRFLAREGAARWKTLEATEFMTTEVHGSFRPFFHSAGDEVKAEARANLIRRFATLADELGDKPYLVGDEMTIADAYLFVMLSWAAIMGIEVPQPLAALAARMRDLPAVQQALRTEGLA